MNEWLDSFFLSLLVCFAWKFKMLFVEVEKWCSITWQTLALGFTKYLLLATTRLLLRFTLLFSRPNVCFVSEDTRTFILKTTFSLISREMTASGRVFEIPELTNIICGFLDRRDCTRLLRVSCCLFCYVRPFVWANVVGAIHLLRLSPGTLRADPTSNSKKVSQL